MALMVKWAGREYQKHYLLLCFLLWLVDSALVILYKVEKVMVRGEQGTVVQVEWFVGLNL